MDAPEVTAFFIAVPAGKEVDYTAARVRLVQWMRDEFPALDFVIAVPEVMFGSSDPPTGPRAFPIMSASMQGGHVIMCRDPDPDLVEAVNRRLAAFVLDGKRLS